MKIDPEPAKNPRGRPRTLDREHILDVAIQAYWEEGVDAISINELCERARVSKPGLYREFTNEDGLMQATVHAYEQKVLAPMLQMLAEDAPFHETLASLVAFVTADDDVRQMPTGCLYDSMRASYPRMGSRTQEQIDLTLERILNAIEGWVTRARTRGELTADTSSRFAVVYLYSQVSHAQLQLARGEPKESVRQILSLAVSAI